MLTSVLYFDSLWFNMDHIIHLMALDGALLHPIDGSITILALHYEFCCDLCWYEWMLFWFIFNIQF